MWLLLPQARRWVPLGRQRPQRVASLALMGKTAHLGHRLLLVRSKDQRWRSFRKRCITKSLLAKAAGLWSRPMRAPACPAWERTG